MALNNLGANSELLSWVVYLHDGKNSVNIRIDNNQSYNSLVIPPLYFRIAEIKGGAKIIIVVKQYD
jgi:hypothetical protein